MLTDVLCCCPLCGLMYSARERLLDGDPRKDGPAEDFAAPEMGHRFPGRDCEGAYCFGKNYRLLIGPLFVPRE